MNKKIILSVVLAVCLVFAMFPVEAQAKQTTLLGMILDILLPQPTIEHEVQLKHEAEHIKILNPVSNPTLWGRWIVRFETEGEGDLEIEAYSGTYFGKDIEFIALTCDDEKVEVEKYFSEKGKNEPWVEGIDNGKVVARDWNCDNKTGRLFLRILATGHHYLKFSFLGETVYAENLADCTGTFQTPCHMCDVSDMDFLLRDPGDSNDPRGWQDMTYDSETGECNCTCYTEDCCPTSDIITEKWEDIDGYTFCPSEGDYDAQTRAYAEGDAWEWEYSGWNISVYNVNYDTDENWCDCNEGATGCNGLSCWEGTNTMSWESGTTQSCCGDDGVEYYNFRDEYFSGAELPFDDDATDDACCNGNDCVYSGSCYASGSTHDLNSDSLNDAYCYTVDRGWINTDYHSSYCSSEGYNWNAGDGDATGDNYAGTWGGTSSSAYCHNRSIDEGGGFVASIHCCCGDDSGENYQECSTSGSPESFSCSGDTTLCCDSSNDCPDDGTCYAQTTCRNDAYCSGEVWYDQDSSSTYCDACVGSGNYYSAGSACCGDDAGEDWETDASTGWCCLDGSRMDNHTTRYSMFCQDGQLYSCNDAGNNTVDENNVSCDRVNDYYCDGDGAGADTWKESISDGQIMDDCDGGGTESADMATCASTYGYYILDDDSVLTFESGGEASDQLDNDADGFYDEVSAAECRISWDGPPCRNITITHTEMTGATVVDATTWTWGGASEPAAMHIHVYNSTDDLIYDELLNRSCGDTGDENDTWSASACSYSAGSGSFDCSISWGDLDLRDTLSGTPTQEDVYNITIGVGDGNDECTGGVMGRGGDGLLPTIARNTCPIREYNDTWCVPTTYSADADSDCCPIGATTSEYPGKDNDDGICVRCWTNNNTQREGTTGNGLCEEKCGASGECDERAVGFSNETVSCSSTCQVNYKPTHSTPLLNSTSGYNVTSDNITCWNQSTSDPDNDPVTNIYNWYKDDTPIMVLNMPFDTNMSTNDISNVTDYSGYKNNGTLKNFDFDADSGWTSSGKVGGAYVFDGSDDFINISSDVGDPSEMTIVLWFKKPNVNQGAQYLLDGRAGGNWWFLQDHVSSNSRCSDSGGNVCFDGKVEIKSGNFSNNVWYHIALTENSSEIKIYLDGVHMDTNNTDAEDPDIGPGMRVGTRYTGSNYFNGTIDQVQIYDSVLSAEQVNALYQESKDGYSFKSTIVSQETSNNDQWICGVTPTDGTDDGTAKNSSTLTVGDDAIDGGSETTCDASNPCLYIKNSTGAVKARFDQFGYVDVKGGYSPSQSSLSPPAGSFMVENSTNDIVLYIDNDGNLATRGIFSKQGSPAPSGSNDFIVQNSTDIAGYIDGGTGNMYFKGLLHYNSNF